MEFTGIITKALPIETGVTESGREWRTREFVVQEEFAEFPQSIGLKARGDTAESPLIAEGNRVKVNFSTRARVFCDRSNKERVASEISAWNVSEA